MAAIPILNSIDTIRKQYQTGECPVLVMCSDMNFYICKYIRNSASPQKLVCELIGAKMATVWGLNAPGVSLVKIKSGHWPERFSQPKVMTTMLGSKYFDSVEYVLPSTFDKLAQTSAMIKQLLKIALYDFWVANEDRNENNSNLLYDIINKAFVPIDFGCILNNADFQSPMMQLTTSDTILNSPLFKYLAKDASLQTIQKHTSELRKSYMQYINQCREKVNAFVEYIPSDWKVPENVVKNKLMQLFDSTWVEDIWMNFEECLNDNI